MAIFAGEVIEPSSEVKIQESEVECAAWVPLEHAADLLDGHVVPSKPLESIGRAVKFEQIREGLGEGHKFGLRHWLQHHDLHN